MFIGRDKLYTIGPYTFVGSDKEMVIRDLIDRLQNELDHPEFVTEQGSSILECVCAQAQSPDPGCTEPDYHEVPPEDCGCEHECIGDWGGGLCAT